MAVMLNKLSSLNIEIIINIIIIIIITIITLPPTPNCSPNIFYASSKRKNRS